MYLLLVLLPLISSQFSDGSVSVPLRTLQQMGLNVVYPELEDQIKSFQQEGPLWVNNTVISMKMQNVQVVSSKFDWTQVTINQGADNTQIKSIQMLQLSFDYEAHYMFTKTVGKGQATVQDIDLDFSLKFIDQQDYSAGFQISVLNFKPNYKSLSVDLKSIILNPIINSAIYLFYGTIQKQLSDQVNDLNSQINTFLQTKNSTQIQNQQIDYRVTKSFTINQQKLEFSVYLKITDLTTSKSYYFQQIFDLQKREIYDDLGEVNLGNNIINQLVKLVTLDANFGVLVNNNEFPKDSPIGLNTTMIWLLFPKINDQYQQNLGMYAFIKPSDFLPSLIVRNGNLMANFGLDIKFYVDKDSSLYPQEYIQDCTTCELAVDMKVQAFGRFQISTQQDKLLLIQIQTVQFNDVSIQDNIFDVDNTKILNILNDSVDSFINMINDQLKTPIENPLIGNFGLSKLGVELTNSMKLRFEFSQPSQCLCRSSL